MAYTIDNSLRFPAEPPHPTPVPEFNPGQRPAAAARTPRRSITIALPGTILPIAPVPPLAVLTI